jgi:CRP-like cAMP-binding protein
MLMFQQATTSNRIDFPDDMSSLSKSKENAHEQLLSKLRSAKNGLHYLTQNDWVLLLDRAKSVTFKKGEKLIQQGKQTRVVYLLVTGKAGITVGATKIAEVTPGQVCGEMAFLEDSLASATASAEEDLEAFTIAWGALVDLFELYPHLASRFYRSLAVNLSRRLREQINSK